MEEGVGEAEKGTASSQRSGQDLGEILYRINEMIKQINQIAPPAEEQTATTSEITMKYPAGYRRRAPDGPRRQRNSSSRFKL